MQMTLEDKLKRWEALAEAATPGPYRVDWDGPEERPDNWYLDSAERYIGTIWKKPEAELLAISRTAIPELIEIVRKMKAALQWYANPKSYSGSAEDPDDGVIPGHRVECGHPLDPPDYDWEPDCGEIAIRCLKECEGE